MKTQSDDWSVGLDSFLDIVTNAIGFLVLVALLVAISSQNMSVLVSTPVLQPAPKGAKRVLFECRRNRILRLDDEAIDRNVLEALRRRARAAGSAPDPSEIPAILRDADIGDAFYRAKAELAGDVTPAKKAELVLIYEPRSAEQGEPIESLHQPSSPYAALIRSLDANKHYVQFIVRPDSFEVFREARKMAHDRGLAIGWDPHPLAEELRFSPSGRLGTRVQDKSGT